MIAVVINVAHLMRNINERPTETIEMKDLSSVENDNISIVDDDIMRPLTLLCPTKKENCLSKIEGKCSSGKFMCCSCDGNIIFK